MSVISYVLIAAIIIGGIWYTYTKFRNIEKGTSKRQKRMDEDIKVKEKNKGR
ncbi:MAG TPA: hypothetical protein VK112_12600 [Fodinibius sp.]|nr:hypothetical protein [Fodinibius sp.]